MALDFGTVAGIAAATLIVVQAILTALAPAPALRARIGPLAALIVAVLLAVLFALASGGLLIVALATGITAAGVAMGGHDVASSAGVPI